MENRAHRQGGAMLIAFSILLIVVLGFIGLALDVGQVIGRKTELQNLADNAALAAAPELVGTAAGLANAVAKAKSSAADRSAYQRRMQGATLSDDSIRFASAPDAPATAWYAAGAVPDPAKALFVRVDTQGNTPSLGSVATAFLGVWSPALRTLNASARAVAGRVSLRMTPLAICALSTAPASLRTNPGPPERKEALEYGFRRGVAYNLFNLNPNGPAPAHFLLNPLGPLGAVGSPAQISNAAVTPFICSGSMLQTTISGVAIHAHRPFPTELWPAFNARFNQYAGNGCDPQTAPPDTNIRPYPNALSNWWMNMPAGSSAAASASAASLLSVADLPPAALPATIPAASYGPLWSFAKAVQYAIPKPAGDYTAFPTSAWAGLYPGLPTAPASNVYYPASSTPYFAPASQTAPVGNVGVAQRRVLNIALLACPLPGGSDILVNVLAIGRFFMTAPAASGMLSAEFAGVAFEQALAGPAELLQ
ncbi:MULTISPECIES: pilus assembly protein TadG-related protein [unclassified Janthinobacterium]|uniref:pilus assembly protein TadG-related protein n=1 Tax=unclassified Janthinobacterium TaxID=2610881 RepID=UPI00161FFD03|nr:MULTISPECIES: pilus assembly protein TadG-related protein [unclassified Janthinobacterium]MBB5370267.1 Flp pilus assembly protein TadG [Janthinobacterium sp. K2C7]MBB5383073.1 Flp pilus assembly protein TadG [Janthinobacterium sp. K2Li3]MBB5388448.1 Flp pilus assembly protein TadG [Janthinobacterium sp. K2E3]